MIQEVQKKRDLMKKILFILLLCLFALLLIVGIFYGVSLYFSEPKKDEDHSLFYYAADYNEDIFQNKAYLGYERGLLFCAGNVTQLYEYETDYDSASKECQFFLDYFQTVINGKYESLPDLYVSDYFKEPPHFTMQMIYEPYVKYHSIAKEEIDGEEVEIYNFLVRYKIFKNNGTFRRGIKSNSAVPQIYQLIKSDGKYQILRILEVEYED